MNVFDINDIAAKPVDRLNTTFDELDWAIGRFKDVGVDGNSTPGWGLPKGMISLWGGENGIGKTRVIVEIVKRMDMAGHSSLVFQGEVSPEQFKGEKMHNYVPKSNIWVSSETAVDEQMRIIQELKPSLVVTDSVQQIEEYNGGRGAKNIVRKARTALSYGGHLIFISQLTVGKTPRGGTALPHEVDIVCTLERWDPVAPPIFVMTVGKNRFGTTGRQVLFAHKEDGVECQSQMRLADTDWAMSHGTRVRSMIGWRLVEEPTPAKREGILMGCIKGIFGRRSNTAST